MPNPIIKWKLNIHGKSDARLSNGIIIYYKSLKIEGKQKDFLNAVDSKTGDQIWEREIKWGVTSLSLSNEFVLFGQRSESLVGDSGYLLLLDKKTGMEKWSIDINKNNVYGITTDGKNVYFGIGPTNNCIKAVDIDTSEEIWSCDTKDQIPACLSIENNIISYSGWMSYFGELYTIDTNTVKSKLLKFYVNSIGVNTISDNIIYFGIQSDDVDENDRKYYFNATDTKNGQDIWRYPTIGEVNSEPLFNNGLVYFVSYSSSKRQNYLYAVNAKTGKKIWDFDTEITGNVISPSVFRISENTVYLGASDNYLYAIDSITGEVKWKYNTKGNISDVFIQNNIVYFIDGGYVSGYDNYTLYALDI